jgi:hypothetical protein
MRATVTSSMNATFALDSTTPFGSPLVPDV